MADDPPSRKATARQADDRKNPKTLSHARSLRSLEPIRLRSLSCGGTSRECREKQNIATEYADFRKDENIYIGYTQNLKVRFGNIKSYLTG